MHPIQKKLFDTIVDLEGIEYVQQYISWMHGFSDTQRGDDILDICFNENYFNQQ